MMSEMIQKWQKGTTPATDEDISQMNDTMQAIYKAALVCWDSISKKHSFPRDYSCFLVWDDVYLRCGNINITTNFRPNYTLEGCEVLFYNEKQMKMLSDFIHFRERKDPARKTEEDFIDYYFRTSDMNREVVSRKNFLRKYFELGSSGMYNYSYHFMTFFISSIIVQKDLREILIAYHYHYREYEARLTLKKDGEWALTRLTEK